MKYSSLAPRLLLPLLGFAVLPAQATNVKVTKKAPHASSKPKPKPKPRVAPKPGIGIKKQPQMTGAVGRFGEIYGLKSGYTYQILSARYSYEPFDDYDQTYAATGNKLLILRFAVKNDTPEDGVFLAGRHYFQVEEANHQLFEANYFRSSVDKNTGFEPHLKPGQGVGQGNDNIVEAAIPIAEGSPVIKLILSQGRKGSKEDVMRFFIAGAPNGDPKNVIAPAPHDSKTTPLKPEGVFPSGFFDLTVKGVSFVSGTFARQDAPDNRRWAVLTLGLKNPTSVAVNMFSLFGRADGKVAFTDGDGESYPLTTEVLKASSDEVSDADLAPGQEKTVRVAFAVPLQGELKTLTLGANSGKYWVLDASLWK